jgi:hypothetical protein
MSDQTPMGKIIGKWPGDETDEEIQAAMDAMDPVKQLREENAKLRDQLRWRDAWGEPPTEHGNYLVQRYEYYGGAELMVLHWNGKWPLRAISHWRPIGPLPGGE